MALRPASQGEKLESAQLLQLIREATPGVFDPNGQRFVLSCLKGDFQREEEWETFIPDAVRTEVWAQNSKEHCVYTAQVKWDYIQAFILDTMTFGAPIVTDPAPAVGVIEEVYALGSYDGRELITFTLERGQPRSCERCTYGLLVSISREADRDGQVMGNLTILARKPEAVGVPMTGGVAQNHRINVAGTTISDALILSIQKQGLGAQGGSVTLPIPSTANQIRALLEAHPDIDAATVTGTGISAGTAVAEVQTLATGAAYTGGAVDLSIAGNATPQSITPGDTLASIRAKIETLIGAAANSVTATGTTAGATGIQNPTVAPTFGNGGPTWGGATGVYGVKYTYATATSGGSETLPSPAGSASLTNGASTNTTVSILIPAGGVAALRIYMETAPGNGIYKYVIVADSSAQSGGSTGSFGALSGLPAGGAASAPTTSTAGTIGVFNLTLTLPAGVNYAQITSTKTGVTTATTTQGAPAVASADFVAEITQPEKSDFAVAVVGGTGYLLTTPQRGSDGRLNIAKRKPIMPQHFSVRVAETRDLLSTAPIAGKIKIASWSIENLVEAVWFAVEGETSYSSHADSDEMRVTLTLRAAVTSAVHDTLLQYKNEGPSKRFWVEIRDNALDNKHLRRYQFLVSIVAAAQIEVAGKVRARTFTLRTMLSDTPFNENLVTDGGASMYVISRRAA